MTFGVEEFQELIRLLAERPEWRAELRRYVLSEDLLELPDLARQLVEAQLRSEHRLQQLTARIDDLTQRLAQVVEQIAQLTQRMVQVEEQIAQLTEQIAQLTARVDELATAQVRTEQRLERLIARVDAIERDLSNLRSEFRGYRLEWRYIQRPAAYFGPLLRRLRLVWPSEAVDQHEDRLPRWAAEELLRADLLVTGVPRYQTEIGDVWLVVEISARIDRGDVERAVRRAEALRAAGLRVLPAVAGERTTQGAKSAVQELTVVLFKNGAVEGWEEALQRWTGQPSS